MKLEYLYTHTAEKHCYHITENGSEKIQFKNRFPEKMVDVLAYVNKYCKDNNMRVISADASVIVMQSNQ